MIGKASLTTAKALIALVAVLGAGALPGGASADVRPPALVLNGVTVTSDGVVVHGTVDADAALVVEGSAVDVNASGEFTVTVGLHGNAAVDFSLVGDAGEAIDIRIPLEVLLDDPNGALDALVRAGISVHLPPEGFRIVDGEMPLVTVEVLNRKALASLKIGGRNVLGLLGRDGIATIRLPGSESKTREVVVTATDNRGVSQSSSFAVTRVRSAISTKTSATVSAALAKGIRIAKVKVDRSQLRTRHVAHVTVTVKDRRGFLVQGAAVRLRSTPGSLLVGGATRAGFSSRLGTIRFTLKLRGGALAGPACKHLSLLLRAETPNASARKRVGMRLPLAPRA